MKRKLVRQGKNALTLTLPISWTREKGLTAKDEVEVTEADGDLAISAQAKTKPKATSLHLRSGNQKYVEALFRNLYINGYDEIELTFEGKNDELNVAKAIESLIGYEITLQNAKGCTVKNLSPSEYAEYESLFKKIWYATFSMQELVQGAMNKKTNKHDTAKMEELSKQASKFSCFSRRVIFKMNMYKDEEGLAKHVIINLVHMMARNYATIYAHLKNPVKSTTQAYERDTQEFIRSLFNAYCKKDMAGVENVLAQRKPLLEKGLANMKNDPVIMHYLLEIVRLCGTAAGKVGFVNALQVLKS